MAEHIALLGDSIFDNASYTGGLPDVVTHLRQLLPAGSKASLLAVDGSTTADLGDQVDEIPSDVTRVVVSIGGNNALLNADLLNLPVASTQEALILFGKRVADFEQSYRAALAVVLQRVPNTTVCTIYNGNFPDDQAPPRTRRPHDVQRRHPARRLPLAPSCHRPPPDLLGAFRLCQPDRTIRLGWCKDRSRHRRNARPGNR